MSVQVSWYVDRDPWQLSPPLNDSQRAKFDVRKYFKFWWQAKVWNSYCPGLYKEWEWWHRTPKSL